MPDVTATEAARQFSDLLDAVEHDGECFTIVRHGKAIAQIEPVARGRGEAAKEILRKNRPDARWTSELADVRDLLEVQERS
ncbi:MAG: type II toxin-antitoxin system Phd/YefM family antitoxin [Acidimicrobiales bacterium]